MTKAAIRDPRYAPRRLEVERRADGTLVLYNPTPRSNAFATAVGPLAHWWKAAPDRVWLAERSGEGWRTLTYGEAHERQRALSGGMKGLGLPAGGPLLILARNGIDHALVAYAAMGRGLPIAPVSPQYGLPGADLSRLAHAVEVIRPAAIYVDDAAAFAGALEAEFLAGLPVIASRNARPSDLPLETLFAAQPASPVARPDDIAK